MASSVHHWRYEKIVTVEKIKAIAERLRQGDRTVVTVNGSFDLMHAGHLDMLEEAKQQGDALIVGLNSDSSVREGKGLQHPIIPQEERAALLAALACVDYVVIVEAPYGEVHDILLRAVRPHVHVNGSEYGPPEQWIEWRTMQEVGAKGYMVERREGLATSDIVKKIEHAHGHGTP